VNCSNVIVTFISFFIGEQDSRNQDDGKRNFVLDKPNNMKFFFKFCE
jgi:hypothetical protein